MYVDSFYLVVTDLRKQCLCLAVPPPLSVMHLPPLSTFLLLARFPPLLVGEDLVAHGLMQDTSVLPGQPPLARNA